jgi:pimeloyl-ACP methyl ester carboxylesterase
MDFVTVQGHRLEYELLEGSAGAPTIVMLHEGLGSISMWRDFPRRVADATGCPVLVYSRYGYGRSDPLEKPRQVCFMHDEGLNALPELLDRLGIRAPILFGHSDGASIAIIYAGGTGRPLAGLVLMAPHVLVEDISIRSIAAAKVAYETTDLRAKLARHHADPDSAFRGWNDIWLHPDFRDWNIEDYAARIRVPVLAIQGEDDEYGTMDQIERIARLAPDVELLKLADCRHSPHRDQPEAVLEAVARFVRRVGGPRAAN